MLDQILKLWAAEFGTAELAVPRLIQSASMPFRELLLRVAADLQDRHKVCPRRLGIWLGEKLGRPAAGWKLERRIVHKQAA